MSDKKNDINISSINQSGGITAHTVNIGKQQRKLDSKFKNAILEYLPADKSKEVRILTVNDGEAHVFAKEIENFVRENGYARVNFIIAFFDEHETGAFLIRNSVEIEVHYNP